MSIVPLTVAAAAPMDPNADLRPLLESLRAEVRALSRQLNELRERPMVARPAQTPDGAPISVEMLPILIARAAAGAMLEQHKTNLRELADLRREIAEQAHRIAAQGTTDAQRIKRDIDIGFTWLADELADNQQRPASPTRDTDEIVRQLDTRFTWLVDELSARIVTVGNTLVRIEQQLVPVNKPQTGTNGHSERPATAHTTDSEAISDGRPRQGNS